MTELSTPVATTSTPPLSLTSGQLPRFIEPIVLAVSLAVIAALQLVLGGFNVATWLIFSALVYLLAIGVFSAIVEGRRKSTDRVVRGLVTAAFVLAVAPLISTLCVMKKNILWVCSHTRSSSSWMVSRVSASPTIPERARMRSGSRSGSSMAPSKSRWATSRGGSTQAIVWPCGSINRSASTTPRRPLHAIWSGSSRYRSLLQGEYSDVA